MHLEEPEWRLAGRLEDYLFVIDWIDIFRLLLKPNQTPASCVAGLSLINARNVAFAKTLV